MCHIVDGEPRGGNSAFRCMEGALTAGHDLDVQMVRDLQAAESHCTALANCTAFTYELNGSTAAGVTVFYTPLLLNTPNILYAVSVPRRVLGAPPPEISLIYC